MNRRAIITKALLIIPFVSGCGFQPLYKTNNPQLTDVKVIISNDSPKRIGFLVNQELNHLMGSKPNIQSNSFLNIDIKNSYFNSGIGVNSFTNRTNIDSSVTFSLNLGEKQANMLNSAFVISDSYNTGDNAYGEISLNNDTEEKIAKKIANHIYFEITRSLK
jgi:hypothetical protein